MFELAEVGFVGVGERKGIQKDDFVWNFVAFERNAVLANVKRISGVFDDIAARGVVFADAIMENYEGTGGPAEFLVGHFDDVTRFDKFAS